MSKKRTDMSAVIIAQQWKSYEGSQCNKINQCKVFGLEAEVLIALSLDYLNYAEISDDCRRSGDAIVIAD